MKGKISMNYNECTDMTMPDTFRMKVGYAWVPMQKLGKVYTPEKALERGTIFPELDISISEYERGLYDGK